MVPAGICHFSNFMFFFVELDHTKTFNCFLQLRGWVPWHCVMGLR